jgi:methylthioribose-1-phosphate isomerase
MVLEAIRYKAGSLEIIDQLLLPRSEVWLPVKNSQDAWTFIKEMRVRGAPAIAIVAILSVSVMLQNPSSLDQNAFKSTVEMKSFLEEQLDYLVTSRPTAVNLADAVTKLKKIILAKSKEERKGAQALGNVYIQATEVMLKEDVRTNKTIGDLGADWILAATGSSNISVLTHCNTGYEAS